MDHGSLVSPEFMVLADEIVDAVQHFMRGIPMTEETMAIDLIDKVGPGGHFIEEDHTMDHFRDVRYSNLFERMVYDEWKGSGAETFEERLRRITLEKMKHRPDPLPEDVIKELDDMQARWE
jgi:trimethylamine--corrinoid protein Co-methyltransferase